MRGLPTTTITTHPAFRFETNVDVATHPKESGQTEWLRETGTKGVWTSNQCPLLLTPHLPHPSCPLSVQSLDLDLDLIILSGPFPTRMAVESCPCLFLSVATNQACARIQLAVLVGATWSCTQAFYHAHVRCLDVAFSLTPELYAHGLPTMMALHSGLATMRAWSLSSFLG
jgi:hypothetical protein